MREKGLYRKIWQPGPGGWSCTCCGPAPGKQRKRLLQSVRRGATARLFRDLVEEGLAEMLDPIDRRKP